MDRTALVFYLQNIRDLEVVKYSINKKIEQEEFKFQKEKANNPTKVNEKDYYSEDYSPILLSVIGMIICAIAANYCIGHSDRPGGILMALGFFLVFVPLFVIALSGVITHTKTLLEAIEHNKKNDERYRKEVATAEKNKMYLSQIEKTKNKTIAYLKNELNKVDSCLNKFYSMNIIPKQYRDLSPVCYLYDYMSTSQQSFEMALLSNQIEDGIRRIEARLDIIAGNLRTVIWQQRVMRDENRQNYYRQDDQYNRMLDSLKRMEGNQKNIEEYTRLSAYYNEAQGIIANAYYLRDF